MELTDRLYQAFNAQYVTELTNALIYANLQNQAEAGAWDGFAAYFGKASKEELEHADAFRSFMIDRNRTPELNALPAQRAQGHKPLEWIGLALEAETQDTKRILDLHTLCGVEKDIDAQIFLFPYIEEQRKAERELLDWQTRLQRSGSNAADLILDKQIGG